MRRVGDWYRDGRAVKQDDVKAVQWYKRSGDRNYYAKYALGLMYLDGRGVKQDDTEAVNHILPTLRGALDTFFRDDIQKSPRRFTPDFWKTFQTMLIDQNYYKGEVDGVYSESVRLAIERYRKRMPLTHQ